MPDEYSSPRTYGFGDAIIGSRGLLRSSLTTYFAAQFRFDSSTPRTQLPVPSVYDADVDRVHIRSAYAEVDQLFDVPALRPVYARAGRQFRYGPAIAHFDGLTAGYDGRGVHLGAYAGRRVSQWDVT